MALCKRGKIWWVRFSQNGNRIQKSTGTSNRQKALQYHDKIKAQLWDADKLKQLPKKTWIESATRWIEQNQHKKSLCDDIFHLRWLDPYLKNHYLMDIDQDMIEFIAQKKEKTGVSPASVNRMLEVVRAILRKAEREWGWLDKTPAIRMRYEDNRRIRWLSKSEAQKLLSLLPLHLKNMAIFTLATGLRKSNVTRLKWRDIDLSKRHAHIHSDESKSGKAIPIPLNEDAIAILNKQPRVSEFVFTYKGRPIKECNTKAWRKALQKAGITNFRWHDLRHSWASWHVQSGTTLQELQQLGGWSDLSMVLRYAHLSSDHLQAAANRITGTKLVHSILQ